MDLFFPSGSHGDAIYRIFKNEDGNVPVARFIAVSTVNYLIMCRTFQKKKNQICSSPPPPCNTQTHTQGRSFEIHRGGCVKAKFDVGKHMKLNESMNKIY